MAEWILPFPETDITCRHGKVDELHPNGHRGTDFGKGTAKAGAPVKAISHGRVAMSEFHHNLGNVVVVKHATGKFSYYCHLAEPGAKLGEAVPAGGVIGKIGNTGQYSFGAHLHCGVSDDREGVYSGKVYDIVEYVKEQQKVEAKPAKAAAPAAPKKAATPKAKAE